MSDKSPAVVRKTQDRDPRVARSTYQLGDALVQLILEQDFSDITVEDILRRAGVSRSTFYAHYRNKNDVLYSSYERMFGIMERALDRAPSGIARTLRVVPVTEFCEHLGESNKLVVALQQSGQMEELWDLALGFIAAMIERRIAPDGPSAPSLPPSLIARMLAGAFLEMVRWWIERPASSNPQQMDVAFHEIARTSLASAHYRILLPRIEG
ncbi:MAG: TetR/AcrR family transcriptional regulator [Gemmatimonas sp.]